MKMNLICSMMKMFDEDDEDDLLKMMMMILGVGRGIGSWESC